MKKLISALTVKQAHKEGLREISAPVKTTIITPEAFSVAKDLGIRFADQKTADSTVCSEIADEALIRQIVERVINQLPQEKRQPELIKNVVADVLAKYVK